MRQQGSIAVPLLIICLLLLAGFGVYFYNLQNVQPNHLPESPVTQPSHTQHPKEAGSSDSLCNGYYVISGNTGSNELKETYDLLNVSKKAEQLGLEVTYKPERFHEGAPLSSLAEKGIEATPNQVITKNGIIYKVKSDSYEAFAPQLTIQKKINGGLYRIIIEHHWRLDGTQSVSLQTDSLEIPVLNGTKTDRVSDQEILKNFSEVLQTLEVEHEFLSTGKVNKNGCPIAL